MSGSPLPSLPSLPSPLPYSSSSSPSSPPARAWILRLPYELLCEVGKHGADRDLVSLGMACRQHLAVLDDRATVWGPRYEGRYDLRSVRSLPFPLPLATRYREFQRRERVINRRTGLMTTLPTATPVKLIVLIKEAFDGVNVGEASKNLAVLKYIVEERNHLGDLYNDDLVRAQVQGQAGGNQGDLVKAILFHLGLGRAAGIRNYGYAKQVAFGHPLQYPLVINRGTSSQASIPVVLAVECYFKGLLTSSKINGPAHHSFTSLNEWMKPQPWSEKLCPGLKQIGKHWRGLRACMLSESALACRRGVLTRAGDWPILTDEPDEGDDAFTSMDLSFLEHHQPDGADTVVAMVINHLTRAHDQNLPSYIPNNAPHIPFVGEVSEGLTEGENFLCFGSIRELDPIDGVPGWQRFQMFRYTRMSEYEPLRIPRHGFATKLCDDVINLDPEELNTDAIHCPPEHDLRELVKLEMAPSDLYFSYIFEGIILPGGKIIVGRWYRAQSHDVESEAFARHQTDQEMWHHLLKSGPFVYWSVGDQ